MPVADGMVARSPKEGWLSIKSVVVKRARVREKEQACERQTVERLGSPQMLNLETRRLEPERSALVASDWLRKLSPHRAESRPPSLQLFRSGSQAPYRKVRLPRVRVGLQREDTGASTSKSWTFHRERAPGIPLHILQLVHLRPVWATDISVR